MLLLPPPLLTPPLGFGLPLFLLALSLPKSTDVRLGAVAGKTKPAAGQRWATTPSNTARRRKDKIIEAVVDRQTSSSTARGVAVYERSTVEYQTL
jgi:hypothetical protein